MGVSNSKYDDTALIRPHDHFFPMTKYVKKYGDPLAPRNRKLNHTKTVIQGVAGVIVPADENSHSLGEER